MWLVLKMAFRNIMRNLRRTSITVLSIASGLAIILWLQCLMAGGNVSAIEKVTSSQIGKLQIMDPKYFQEKNIRNWMKEIPENLDEKMLPGVSYSQRINLPSLISSGDNSISIFLVAVEPTREMKVTNLHLHPKEGEFLSEDAGSGCETPQIYLGKTLADLLRVELGSKVVLLSQAADGTLGNELFRIQGIFNSGSRDFDRAYAFTSIECAKKLSGVQGPHEIVINFKGEEIEKEQTERLKAAYAPKYLVLNWREVMPRMDSLVKYNTASLLIVGIMLFLVINLGIINTFLVSVFERTREFGVMIALGTPSRAVIGMVVAECLVMSLLASAIGTLIGIGAVFYYMKNGFDISPYTGTGYSISSFSMDLLIYPVFKFGLFLKTVFYTNLTVCLAGIYPAIRASRLEPIDAIRSQ